ncbi:MAG: cobalamin biosynthesis protein [Colwellia sp.]|nr:cobalamin biosynthesis protein [Colwellia sp.]MCW8863330.1 cobalamin biosynthesis protein [Colwellia sp.]MCW9080944.1 cobalamin biosynthesis protein [Colwellia sp.]
MTDFPALSPFSYQLLILLTAMISKGVISHFTHHEPLRLFQFYCQRLSDKVNKPQNSPQQQTIAGLVAILITLTPITLILWLFEAFIEVDFLWQFFLLYLAIGSFGLSSVNKTIAQALVAKQNYLAKQTLKPLLLRETEPLSSLGLSKAAIEMKLLRTIQQGYSVAVIFLLAGPLAAISYRLLLEMHYCWNSKLERFSHFGLHSKLIVNLLQWLPVRIFSMLMLFTSLGKNFLLFWRLSKKHFFQLDNDIALLLLALSLEVKLGGVAMYSNSNGTSNKLRKTSFNDLARQPQITDIIHANSKVNYLVWFSLLVILLTATSIELVIANI